ncbi:MAG: zinc-binding dehydrogenase [Chloroflexi bacterium]|nr:zinc-binding dehydrogenase [Chloroflexota bacterium]
MLALMKTSPGPGNVRLEGMPEPQPGPGQVKIEVKAAGICGSDLHILHSDIHLNLRPPVIMGHEFCGVVSALGEGVDDLRIGERVTSETAFSVCGTCLHCQTGNYNLCNQKYLIGYVYHGCFTKYCIVPRMRVHRLPENLSFHEGVMCEPLACCAHAVSELTVISPSETAVVAGPGSIGLLCMQIARAAGAFVVVSGVRADETRLSLAHRLGANVTVNVEDESLSEVLLRLTDGRGADVYLECSGSPAAARAGLEVTRKGGRYTQVGLASGAFPLDFAQVAYRELKVTGSIGSKWTSWITALNLLRSGQVQVAALVNTVYPLSKWEEAFRAFEDKSALKVLLIPED